jgi:HPt (histidine-containing phosphotransfer) domain-containing protein
LLSADMLEMFENIRVSTGTNLKQKVFELFSASAVPSYEAAAAEIRSQGPEAKRLIHALKSNCSSSGALQATVLCQKIEMIIAEGRIVDNALLETLFDALLETIESMRTLAAYAFPNIAEGLFPGNA